jgi:hypothetical protein
MHCYNSITNLVRFAESIKPMVNHRSFFLTNPRKSYQITSRIFRHAYHVIGAFNRQLFVSCHFVMPWKVIWKKLLDHVVDGCNRWTVTPNRGLGGIVCFMNDVRLPRFHWYGGQKMIGVKKEPSGSRWITSNIPTSHRLHWEVKHMIVPVCWRKYPDLFIHLQYFTGESCEIS